MPYSLAWWVGGVGWSGVSGVGCDGWVEVVLPVQVTGQRGELDLRCSAQPSPELPVADRCCASSFASLRLGATQPAASTQSAPHSSLIRWQGAPRTAHVRLRHANCYAACGPPQATTPHTLTLASASCSFSTGMLVQVRCIIVSTPTCTA